MRFIAKSSRAFKCRPDMVNDVLLDACRRAEIAAKKEAPLNFLTDPLDGRSTLRPADVLIFGWVRGKHACVDLTGVSPLVGLSCRGFTIRQAALKAASYKVTKHEKACIENRHVFIPFAFDTFGFLAPEVVALLNRVQRVMHRKGLCILVSAFWFLRFVSCDLVSCVLTDCVLVLRFGLAFCLVEDFCCVLLRRDSAKFKTSLRFVSRLGCGLLQDLLRFATRFVAFCSKTSCVLLQDSYVLSQDSCVLSQHCTAFCLPLKTFSAFW
nr:auxilin-like protein [Tanacetum cinerariifolium]